MNFKRALEPVVLCLASFLSSCSTGARGGVVVANCVSDPDTQSLQCTSAAGVDSSVPWAQSKNYVCRPPEDDQVLNEAARLK